MLLTKIPENEQEKLLNEIGYGFKQLNADLTTLKQWLASQEHLPPCRLEESDEFFIYVLTNAKGSLETAKRKLDAYYSYRSSESELMSTMDPFDEKFLATQDKFNIALIPGYDSDGTRLSIAKVVCGAEEYDFLWSLKRIFHLIETRMRIAGVCLGDHVVLDGDNFTPGHILRLNPLLVRDVIVYLESVLPTRIKSFTFINCPSYLEMAVNKIFLPFLSKKLQKRVCVTAEGNKALQSKFPLKMLPKEYGGDAPSLKTLSDNWLDEIKNQRKWFINEVSQKTDESKRKDTAFISSNPYFGVQGTLKKLCID